jgi:hypothetical protein
VACFRSPLALPSQARLALLKLWLALALALALALERQ